MTHPDDKDVASQSSTEQPQAVRDWSALESALSYQFQDRSLLEAALTHPSYAHENPDAVEADNQRLEFLGDAMLGLSVARVLYDRYPDHPEGKLSPMKSALVCEDTLASLADGLGLGKLILLGRGEKSSGGGRKASILSDAMEAVLAAVYIDGGYREAARVIDHLFADLYDEAHRGRLVLDYKTLLQEYAQSLGDQRPIYRVTERRGPPHDRVFRIEVSLGGTAIAEGEGRSKKEAEKNAAGAALEVLMESAEDET